MYENNSYPTARWLSVSRSVLLCLASLFAAASVCADPTDPAGELVSFVRDAATLIEERGEAVFPEFRTPGGKWFDGDRYVFVWELDGLRRVYPPDPPGEGRNMADLKDIHDKPIGLWMLEKARSPRGEGWIHYQWPRPGEIFPVWKSTYVRRAVSPAGTAYMVGSGRYNLPLDRNFVVELVDDAASMLGKLGVDGFDRLRDDSGEYVFMDTYVFVLSLEGVEYVNPAFPNLEGRNLLDYRDAAGNLLVRQMIDETAEAGSAWVSYFWPRPGSGDAVKKLAYVRRVDVDGETMIVGAGLYEPAK